MALLRANVDSTIIRLLGRWRSWAMLHYLHRSATNTSSYASTMLFHGEFSISTHAKFPLPDDVISKIPDLTEADLN